jgi:hypothetical protein
VRTLRRGASPFVDVGWALYECALILGDLLLERAQDACHWWMDRRGLPYPKENP